MKAFILLILYTLEIQCTNVNVTTTEASGNVYANGWGPRWVAAGSVPPLLCFVVFWRPALWRAGRLAARLQDCAVWRPHSSSDPSSSSCYQFEVGHPDKLEFYSPSYPENYSSNINCVRIITAQERHTLKLDFRDRFTLEPSDGCKYDYLEIRDGENGYDPLLGRYCGNAYPPVILSSGRSLWLRFKSDETVEYRGFRAIWEEVPMPDTKTEIPELKCRKELRDMDEGFVNKSDIDQEMMDIARQYKIPLECMWVISVQPGWRIQLQFLKFTLAVPNNCLSNFVDVFPESTDLPSRLYNFCGSIAETVQSPSNVLQIRFQALEEGFESNFEALFTTYRDKLKSALPVECADDEFDCEDATCISINLKCNGRANCRFRSDEDPIRCQTKEGVLSVILNTEHMLIILIVFFLILFGMCCAFLYNCFRKLIRDHRIIQEQMRASREAGLDNSLVWKAESPETRESECQTRESVFSELASLRPASVESTKSAPDVIISH